MSIIVTFYEISYSKTCFHNINDENQQKMLSHVCDMNNKNKHDLFFKNLIMFKQGEVETLKIEWSEAVSLIIIRWFDMEVQKYV